MKILTPEEMATLTAHQWRALAKQGITLTDEQAESVRRAREQPNDPEARLSKPPPEQGEIMHKGGCGAAGLAAGAIIGALVLAVVFVFQVLK